MRLRSLELKGFKSFANETTIHFTDDVTGIVGPNGSGKSNIVDAVRWVLGEQKSSQLRLDKMASVIFNGTKKRREAQVAQVTLVFDNTRNVLPTEYATVAVTRILYRSGESEYRLNGVSCRLKDITSLFLDTGIGPDSYAIIALNMVEDLLSDREQARRRMFEQAAGISKYKARKHETQQKLEATAADLDRVEDLLFEIEDQLKKLEKQALRTQKYYELKEEYKLRSVEMAVHSLSRHRLQFKELEGQIAREEDAWRGHEAASRQYEADIEALRKQHTDKEVELSTQQQAVNQLTGRIRSRENDKNMQAQKRSFVENDSRRLQDQIEQNERMLQTLTNEIEVFQTDLNYERTVEADLEKTLEAARGQLEQVRSNHNLIKGNLESFVQAQQAVEREIVELEKTRAIQQSQLDNLERDVERTLSDIAGRKEEMRVLADAIEEKTTSETAQTAAILQLEASEEQRRSDLTDTEAARDALTRRIADHNRQLDARRNEFKLTKSMIERFEGFPESIRFLSSQKDWAQRCPLLSDLIYVQEDYRVVIENFLEPYLNYFVAPDAEEAAQAIALLGRSQKGRANFFLLDAFSGFQPALTLLPDARRAIDLVDVDARYRPLVEFLLENVVVMDVETPPLQVPDSVVVLSKSGSFVRRRFSLSGGSVGLFEGKKIGRKKNLEILDSEIKILEKTENDWNAQLASIRTRLDKLRESDQSKLLQRAREALNQLTQERTGMQARLDNIATFVDTFTEKAGASGKNMDALRESNRQIDHQLTAKHEAAEAARARLRNTDGSFREVAEQLSHASQHYNQQHIEFIRQQNRVTSLQQELVYRQNRSADLQQNLHTARQTLAKNADEIGLLTDDLTRLESDLHAGYAEKKQLEASLSAVEQGYFKARNEIHALENKLRESFRLSQDLQSLINRLKDKFSDVKFEITAISERLRVEFGVSSADLHHREPDPQYNLADLEKDVLSLKRRLDTYGEINPMAIEAYNEIKERYDTIDGQRQDILAAKENLLQTMIEIEDTATRRFLEAFEQVRTNFIRVFRTLFTEEDTADLLLTRPESPLDSDINIIARPKGKRPQTIAQLSGGEKTLTATALLFALYLLKPAPFCIFDEVDAPLDDANIEKFNRIIREFSGDSQFIVVTHNKATMAAVDTIYGVYMPEQGVSSVAPVDFRQLG